MEQNSLQNTKFVDRFIFYENEIEKLEKIEPIYFEKEKFLEILKKDLYEQERQFMLASKTE